VFTQQEGRLSSAYRAWAEACLAAGAMVVEKNVFALASAHRPRHRRYVHALMSWDGAHRFAWRSLASGLPAPADFLLLSNPLLIASDGQEAAAQESPVDDSGPRIRLLRAGRPDPVKWTDWEQRLAAAMAVARPGLTIDLTLVGVPGEFVLAASTLPRSVFVRPLPMLPPADLWAAFSQADAYVHHSRIGETFGNTLAEAQAAGCFCVAGLEPWWDTAPLEVLRPQTSWIGGPGRAVASAGRMVDLIRQHRRAPGPGVTDTPAAHLTRMLGLLDGSTSLEPLPSARRAGSHLSRTGRRLDGWAGSVRAPAREAARAVRWRLMGPRRGAA